MSKIDEKKYTNQHGNIVLVLKPTHRLDITNSWQFRMRLQEYISQIKCHIVVNFSQVKSIDHIGLTSLVAGMQHTKRIKSKFRLCHLNSAAKLLLEMTLMDTLFEVFETEEEALFSLVDMYF